MIINKYKRTSFYNQHIIKNNLENDLVDNYWDLFKIKRPLRYFSITRQFLQRPDLLSYAVYQDMNYWWIIAKYNLIDDWWNDVTIGNTISIPSLEDIDDWYTTVLALKTKKARR
jgi:hypothetical protein